MSSVDTEISETQSDRVAEDSPQHLVENRATSSTTTAGSAAALVKSRTSRERTQKNKLNRINELKTLICKSVSKKLSQYENLFSASEKNDVNVLESHLAVLDHDGNELLSLYEELCSLVDNKIDEAIKTLYVEFQQEREDNVALINAQLDKIDQLEEEAQAAAAAEADEEITRLMNELQERKRRQAEARRLFEQKQGTPRSPLRNVDVDLSSVTTPSETQTRPYTAPIVNYGLETSPPMTPRQSVTLHQPVEVLTSNPTNADTGLSVVSKLAEAITASMKETKRSVIEPSIFYGDVLEFNDWETDFDDFLEAENITGVRQLRILKKYVSGEAKKCVSGFLMSNTTDGYDDARSYLRERYGKKMNLARQFKKKLLEWPKIQPRDGHSLQEFADFLAHCNSATKSVPQLKSLDDPDQNLALMEKLPDWLKIKWKYRIADYEERNDCFPGFSTFAEFIIKEAKATNILSDQSSRDRYTHTNRGSQLDGKPRKVKNFKTTSENQESRTCLYCGKNNHSTDCCYDLVKMSYVKTIEWVNSKRLCYSCAREGHRSTACPNKATCRKCKKQHPTILHKTKEDWNTAKQETTAAKAGSTATQQHSAPTPSTQGNKPEERRPETYVNVKNTKSRAENFSMVVPVYVSTDASNEVLVYALLDNQSDACYITQDIASEISPTHNTEKVSVSTMIGTKEQMMKRYQGIHIRSFTNSERTTIAAYEQQQIPCERHQIPSNVNTERLAHIAQIRKQLPPPLDVPIGLLIGSDCPEALAPIDHIIGAKGEPFAMKTMLGWTVCGATTGKSNLRSLKTHTRKDNEILKLLERDFNDSEGEKLSQDDFKFLDILQQETTRDCEGSYILPLPFKQEIELPCNKPQATKRLNQLIQKLKTNEEYKAEYCKFMNKLIRNGHAERVPETENVTPGKVWYIPHFGVFHPKKKKLRVVFDASAKYNGLSLNDTLLQGPDLMNSLVGILLRFRREEIAICCDIESMFYNFYVPEPQRDYLRFLWINDTTELVEEYRMTVHLFGAKSSPAVATFALRKLATDHKDRSRKAVEFLCDDFYVDDGITSLGTVKEAISLIKDTTDICSQGNVRLHKFISNNREVMNAIPSSERSESTQKIDLNKDKLPNERTLGMQWNVETDCFEFNLNIESKPATKRGILSTIAQVYDPLGLVGPFILRGKQILQKVTSSTQPWDAPVSAEEKIEWEKWLDDLKQLENFHIERWMRAEDMVVKTTQIHVFSDASLKGYGACCYLRQVGQNGQVHTALLFAKSRVAPLKPVTIPRLELQAAVTAVRIHKIVVKELRMKIDGVYFWCDSQVVLGYISNESKRFHMYVANRVHEIHQHSSPSQWNYVTTQDNPADIASRGATALELSESDWRRGPEFLQQTDINSYIKANTAKKKLDYKDPEVRKLQVLTTSTTRQTIEERFTKYSNFNSLVKGLAILRDIVRRKQWKGTQLTVQAILEAEVFAIKSAQEAAYPKEIQTLLQKKNIGKDSDIHTLNPYLAENGLLCVGGRLRRADPIQVERFPVLIPKHSHLARLIVRHYHQKIHHLGQRSTLAAVREAGYWIVSGTSKVKSEIRDCIICTKLRKPHLGQ